MGRSGQSLRAFVATLLCLVLGSSPTIGDDSGVELLSEWPGVPDKILTDEFDLNIVPVGFTTVFADGAPLPPDAVEEEPPASRVTITAEDLDKLIRRLEVLEKDKAKASQDKKKEHEKKKEEDWKDMSSEKWTVRLGGHVQLDYITWPYADPDIVGAQNYFNYRRLRLVADGTGYGVYDFRLQLTLEPGLGANEDAVASPDVKDAYFSINEVPWIGRMRIGNFFVPFGLEQVTNDTNNIFLERSIPTQGVFTADREVGFAIYNCTASQNLSWAAGIFFDDINDTVKSRIDNNQGYRVSGRVNWLPYYDEPSEGRYLVHTGLGAMYTDDYDNIARFRARPQVQRGPFLIDSGALAAGSYATGNAEFAVVWGRVTVQSEAYLTQVNMTHKDPVTIGGAYAHLSYFLTGECRTYERFGQHGAQFGRNKPISNFFATPGGISWGAWEAKTRWSHFNLNNFSKGEYNDITVGFNWYFSDRTRIMFDWIHPVTTSKALFGGSTADLVAMRFDFNW